MNGIRSKFPSFSWGPPPQERFQALERYVEELWLALEEQDDAHENLLSIVQDLESGVKALSER